MKKQYRVTTRSTILTEYYVTADTKSMANVAFKNGLYDSADVISFDNEEVLKTEDVDKELQEY